MKHEDCVSRTPNLFDLLTAQDVDQVAELATGSAAVFDGSDGAPAVHSFSEDGSSDSQIISMSPGVEPAADGGGIGFSHSFCEDGSNTGLTSTSACEDASSTCEDGAPPRAA